MFKVLIKSFVCLTPILIDLNIFAMNDDLWAPEPIVLDEYLPSDHYNSKELNKIENEDFEEYTLSFQTKPDISPERNFILTCTFYKKELPFPRIICWRIGSRYKGEVLGNQLFFKLREMYLKKQIEELKKSSLIKNELNELFFQFKF